MSKQICQIIATYNTYSHFKIPKYLWDVLLSKDECDALHLCDKKPGFWWIEKNILHFYDTDGVEKIIYSCGQDTEYKTPENLEIVDVCMDDDSDSESEQESEDDTDADM